MIPFLQDSLMKLILLVSYLLIAIYGFIKGLSGRQPTNPLAKLNVIIIGKGLNYYETIEFDLKEKSKAVTIADETYNIDQKAFFLRSYNILTKLIHRLKKRLGTPKEVYAIVFRKGQPQPLCSEKSESPLTAGMLKTAEDSTAAKRALQEMFSKHLPTKKLVFGFIVIIILGISFLVFTGQLNLGQII